MAASAELAIIVKPQDLPVYCPNPAMPLWSSHPRVYLDLDENGEARCPYCSTLYRVEVPPRAQH
jgi:uncharacterized Zn-finger protein